MAIDELLSKVKATADKRAADLDAEWWKAVRAAGSGKEVDPDAVAELLERMGRTAEDFAKAAQLQADRLAWAADVAAEPAADKRRAAAQAAIKKLDDALEKARAKYYADREPHDAEVRAADDAARRAIDARGRLLQTCPYPGLHARKKQVETDLTAAEAAVAEWRGRAERVRHSAELPERSGDADYRDVIARAKKRLPDVERELAEKVAERDRLVAALEAVAADMGAP